jgi:hypothetical protein
MSIVLFIVVVLVCLMLLLYGISLIPNQQPPFGWMIQLLLIILAVLLIASKAGVL